MVKNNCLSKSIHDAGWGQFISFITYKAEEAGCYVEKVNPRNTSKMCSVCGYINEDLKLSDRKWTCPYCGTEHNRDGNASINVLDKTIGKELAEFTLGEISSMDDPASSNTCVLKSILSKNQEALSERTR